jgi:transcriptional regulator with XRE-family HTH domain
MTREDFASLLKDFRSREHLTQEAAAAFLGVSLRTWQNWEIARNMPRGFGLRALVLALENAHPSKGKRPHPAKATEPARKSRIQDDTRTVTDPPPLKESRESAPSSLEAHLL